MSSDASPFALLLARRQQRLATGTRAPLPHQVPPLGNWYGWMILAGRGAGKTHACAQYVTDHVNGPACLPGPTPHWIGIIAPTLGDAATSCVKGPSGLEALDPSARMVTTPGGTVVRWPNGSEAKLFGTESERDVDRLRSGGNRCLFWAEELAAWQWLDAAWNHMRFGLRVGPHPHWVGSTTPRPRRLIQDLHAGKVPNVVVTHATMWDNPHLAADVREALLEAYGGKMLGRQELFGEIIEEAEGALWTRAMLDATRVRRRDLPTMERITVGVDPSGGAGEQGIIVQGRVKLPTAHVSGNGGGPNVEEVARGIAGLAGVRTDRVPMRAHGFALADRTVHKDPSGWARAAVKAAVDYDADDIVVETNYGGDMAVATIRTAAEAMGVPVPIRRVTATRGKRVRAEPVSSLTAEGRLHMVDRLADLENQMCTWTEDLGWSPDRLDALVWGSWHLRLVAALTGGIGTLPGSDMAGASLLGERRR